MSPQETVLFVRNVPICHRCKYRRVGECGADERHEMISAKASRHECPLHQFAARGAGDVVASVIHRITGIQPCGGCKKTGEVINRIVPFKVLT